MAEHDFPNDENGMVLRRLLSRGDDLSQSREVSFHFLFPTRGQAIGFIEVLTDIDLRLELSWYDDQQVWQCTVVRNMRPTHANVTVFEERLIDVAFPLDGVPDGWGCFAVNA